ncbi:MAG: enoyl-CoA hydratase/isomerase family protein [Gammaproteobacteria bacterium]|nr:enoyl-CoA hydratase/isomerase family protein [Gammaproteobacteria bacterium]
MYELRDGAAWITLNRPEQRNALSARLVDELYSHVTRANADPQVRCIVLTGAGKGFCAGADLKDPPLLSGSDGASVPDLLTRIWEGEKPVIAAVNGAAFAGGLGLVGAADIVVSVDDALFSFSEVRIGVIPAIIAVVCLRKIGQHHGMRLFLSGERFTGAQAVDYGLVHRAVPREAFQDAVEDEVRTLMLGGPNAIIECKKLVRALEGTTLRQGFELTEQWSKEMFASPEATEGMTAFREKRKPSWVR